MPFTVVLENAKRVPTASVPQDAVSLDGVLPRGEDEFFHYLPYIDRYGDTVFNGEQMQPLLREWQRATDACTTAEQRTFMNRVAELCRQCANTPHLFVRFIGD